MGCQQSVCQLECDACAAKVLVRVGAADLGGIYDGHGLRDAFDAVGEVVVCDDEVEAERLGFGRGREGTDAGVDRDD